MATIIAAAVAKARRDIQHYFFSSDAVRPERAVRFEPYNRVQQRQFEHMQARGIIKDAARGRYWIDVVAYDADMRRRMGRLRIIIALVALLLLGGIALGLFE